MTESDADEALDDAGSTDVNGLDGDDLDAVETDLDDDASASGGEDESTADDETNEDSESESVVVSHEDEAWVDDAFDDDASPFGDELRLPDEHGYDGTDYTDEALLANHADGGDGDDRGPNDSAYDDDASDYEVYDDEADEYEEYADEVYAAADGSAVLFDGDPDEFELDLGGQATYPAARPQYGDVLVLDDAAAHRGPPPARRMSRMERRRRVRLQARRVRRIIRHVEPWSVLKISIFFYACLWVIFLVAGFMIWGVAESSGTVDKIESLIIDLFALDTFDFDAGQIFRGYALGGLALSIAGTTFNVLMCLLFNLISDLTGGLRITMIEEESARPIPPRRRRRRQPPRR